MSAKTTKVTLLATTVLLSALYQSHAFANELPTEPNAIVEVSDAQAEVVGEVTSSEVVTNNSNTEESNGESSSETTSTAPVVSDDMTNSEIVTNSNTSDSNGNVVTSNEQMDSALSSNGASVDSNSESTLVEGANTVEIVNSEPIANVLPVVQTESNDLVVTNSVNTNLGGNTSSSSTQNSSSDTSESRVTDISNDASSGEVASSLLEDVDNTSIDNESRTTIPRSVIANAPVQAASSLGLSSISNVVSSKSTIGQKLFFGLILALMFAFVFSTYNKKKKNDLSYL